jgi:hypothetical protein
VIFRRWEFYVFRQDDGHFSIGLGVYVSECWPDVGRTFVVNFYAGLWRGHVGLVVRRDDSDLFRELVESHGIRKL